MHHACIRTVISPPFVFVELSCKKGGGAYYRASTVLVAFASKHGDTYPMTAHMMARYALGDTHPLVAFNGLLWLHCCSEAVANAAVGSPLSTPVTALNG